MKIRVTDIEPNPFRDLVRNPIQADKVESLKASISDTGFWDNIVVRPKPSTPGKYQLAYGHHRLTGVKELGIEFVDVPCRGIDDAAMLKMMASENIEDWKATTAVVAESVWAAKQYLDDVFDKFETLELFMGATGPVRLRNILSPNCKPGDYTTIREEGVGSTVIGRFLGTSSWEERARAALPALEEESRRAQAERLRKRQEREAAKAEAARQEAERQARIKQMAEAREKEEYLEAKRLAREAEERKARQAEEERVRKEREAELARIAAEEEARRKEHEAELARIAAEEKAKREAQEKAERERREAEAAAERARAAAAKAEKEAAEKAVAEARAAEERRLAEERRAKLEQQQKEEAERRAKEKAEREAREREEARLRAERLAKEKAEREAREKADAERRAKEKAEREAEAARMAEDRRRAQEERAAAEKARKEAEAAAEKARKEAEAAEAARKAAAEEEHKRLEREKQARLKALEHEKEMERLEREGIDRKAFELFEVRKHADAFHRAALNYKIPKTAHFELAKSLINSGIDMTATTVNTFVYDYALRKGYIRKPAAKDKFKEVSFDSLCIGVAEQLSAANKEMRRILREANTILGYDKTPEVYYLHDYFFRANAREQLKKQFDAMQELMKLVNLDPQKTSTQSKDVTPEQVSLDAF